MTYLINVLKKSLLNMLFQNSRRQPGLNMKLINSRVAQTALLQGNNYGSEFQR